LPATASRTLAMDETLHNYYIIRAGGLLASNRFTNPEIMKRRMEFRLQPASLAAQYSVVGQLSASLFEVPSGWTQQTKA